jgi:hypothetical protein
MRAIYIVSELLARKIKAANSFDIFNGVPIARKKTASCVMSLTLVLSSIAAESHRGLAVFIFKPSSLSLESSSILLQTANLTKLILKMSSLSENETSGIVSKYSFVISSSLKGLMPNKETNTGAHLSGYPSREKKKGLVTDGRKEQ